MKVCDLSHGSELHADIYGRPYKVFPKSVGLCPGGFILEILDSVDAKDKALVNAWQADASNDFLRARGDPRWQAACSFTQRKTYPSPPAIKQRRSDTMGQCMCGARDCKECRPTTAEEKGDMGETGPGTLRELRKQIIFLAETPRADWTKAQLREYSYFPEWADKLEAAASAWEADRKRLEEMRRRLQMVCESTDSHHPNCPQFTGPYDLGELEPPCTCWKRAALAAKTKPPRTPNSSTPECARLQNYG